MCVRKRPLTHKESRRGEADVVTASSGECVIVSESKEAVDLTQYILQVDKLSREETVTIHVLICVSALGRTRDTNMLVSILFISCLATCCFVPAAQVLL